MMNGTLKTRREFLCNCGVAAAGLTMPHFLAHTAGAVARENGWEAGSAAPLPGFKDDRILVVVQLSGGNDGLNTIIPHTNDEYFSARPRLALKEDDRIRLTDDLSVHSNLAEFKSLYDEGQVAIVEGVGYPNPNRSHFRSTEIWHTATDSEKFSSTGWIGRYFDNHCSGEAPPTAGVYVGRELPQAFDGDRGFGVAFERPETFGYVAGDKGDGSAAYREMNAAPSTRANDTLDFLRHVTDNANIATDRIHEISRKAMNAGAYPGDPFAKSLATIARMITGGLGSRIYYTALSGFDTHVNQIGAQNRLLGIYSKAVTAFQQDLKKLGQSERVVTMTFSEFGRRVKQNASGGTDHGTASSMFLMGDAVKGGLHGRRPSLTDLDNGDLKFTTDFRAIYGSVLDRWFGVKPQSVLAGDFPAVDIIQAS